jgi:flagellar motor switch protein FliG
MKALHRNIIDGYMAFLENLSPGLKLDIISKLTQSLKSEVKTKDNLFEQSFGAWSGSETAEDIVNGIRDSRTFNRQIEEL